MPINQPVNAYTYQPQGMQNGYNGIQQAPMPNPVPNQYFGNQPNQMNFSSQPGLSIVPITSDETVHNYPVASGNTVLLVNFNTNRMCFKSTNQNGVPMAPRWATFIYDEPQQQISQQNQNVNSGVSREEFEDLKAMLAQALSSRNDTPNVQQSSAYEEDNSRRNNHNGKRGGRNDGYANNATNNG